MKQSLILIDGSSYLFRAFHALPALLNSHGEPTGAIYGVANMIKRLLKDETFTHIAVVFDAKGRTFRDDLYAEYKAHRPPVPSELSCQFQPLVQLLTAMGLPILIIPGVEADDVIATLAHQAVSHGQSVLISTGDKDMAQLVNEHIHLINTMTNQRLDPTAVKTKFGVSPEQIIDYLALIGDSSDNIPGVAKCGPKTACKWLNAYHTLDNLLVHADEITGKVGDNLRSSFEQLALAKSLVTLKTDVRLDVAPTALCLQTQDDTAIQYWANKLEFKTWINKTKIDVMPTTAVDKSAYVILDDMPRVIAWVANLDTASTLYLSLFPDVGISLSIDINSPVYIPLNDTVLSILKPYLESTKLHKIGYDLKSAYVYFRQHDIILHGISYDILLEYYLLDSQIARLDFAAMVSALLPHARFDHTIGQNVKQCKFSTLALKEAAQYAIVCTQLLQEMHAILYAKLAPILKKVLHEIEIPLISVLAQMEFCGVLLDTELLHQQGVSLKHKIQLLIAEAYQLVGYTFNLDSPKQLQTILYHEQGLPILAKTPTGQAATSESVLQILAEQYRLPAVILNYRRLSKLVSTYIDALPKCVNPNTGRVHTSYNQAVTATGRLSSSEPNLQNIPIRTEEGRLIRRAFIAAPEHMLIAADYSQIELRIMAHLSQDSALLQSFAQKLDIHQATASEIFNVALDQVTPEQRRRSKAVNFGLIYGMSAFGLAKQLKIERQEAQSYIDRYFHRYPGVREYMDAIRAQAHTQGYVETLFGRRLYLPDINAHNVLRRNAAERAAINAPMQGTAADIIKKAMIALMQWQESQQDTSWHMIMQVHDELVFEVPQAKVEILLPSIRQHMEHTVTLDVPLSVSIGVGVNWDDAHGS